MNEQSHSDQRVDASAEADGSGLFDFYVEQLETYLDGELQPDEVSQVRSRLAQEPAYAAALERLHRARATRVECFCDESEADDAADRLCETARSLARSAASPVPPADRATLGRISMSGRWIAGGIAACLLVGFTAGLLGRYDFGTAPDPATSNPVPSAPSNVVLVTNDSGEVVRQLPLTPAREEALLAEDDDLPARR